MSRWPAEQTMNFIRELIKYECWYNPESIDSKSRNAKKRALLKISEAMKMSNFGPVAVYRKIRNIKSTYSQEVKKILEYKSIGKTYRPNMAWFKIYHRAVTGVEYDPDESSEEMESVNQDLKSTPQEQKVAEYFFVLDKTKENTQKTIKTEMDDDYQGETEEIYLEENLQNDSDKETTSQRDPFYRAKGDKKAVVQSQTSFMLSSNEFDAFGQSVAAQLKNMPMRQALEAEMFIQNYLSKLRLDLLQPKT